MKTIIEISPIRQRTYTMPDDIYEIVAGLLETRAAKNATRAVGMLPKDMAARVG